MIFCFKFATLVLVLAIISSGLRMTKQDWLLLMEITRLLVRLGVDVTILVFYTTVAVTEAVAKVVLEWDGDWEPVSDRMTSALFIGSTGAVLNLCMKTLISRARAAKRSKNPAPEDPFKSDICRICYDAPPTVILPCRHQILCGGCVELINGKCPLCRVLFKEVWDDLTILA